MKAGDVLGQRYRLERPLGAGGMGAVWEATHLVTHKRLALKAIHDEHDDPAARRRVLREARAACAVNHPNVVTVHDVIENDEGAPVLVMDLLEGESLASRLERERTLPPKDAIAIARAILSALSAAHAVGIIHRDLKPDNVFLVADGVRVLDFGVAKLRGNDPATKETNNLTETGAMVGTPHYMSPEQAFGEADVDARADLWAVGAVLYECLCGVPPTDGQNLGQILKALATGRIAPLRERAPSVPEPLARIVDGLLRVERDERPASAELVIASLDAVGDLSASPAAPAAAMKPSSDPSVTPQPATRSISNERPKRAWIFVAAAAAFVLAGLGGSALFLVRAPVRPPPPAVVVAPPIAASTATVVTEAPSASPAPPAMSAAPPASTSARVPVKVVHKPAPVPSAKALPSASAASGPLLDKPTF